jgi:hypothetical protein
MSGSALENTSFELIDLANNDISVSVLTNETGGYKYGPLSSGDYQYRIDLDDDGFYEISGEITVGEEIVIYELMNVIPDTYDVSM